MRLFNFGNGGKSQPNVIRRVSDYFFGVMGGNQAVAPTLTNESILETASVLAAVKVITEMVSTTPINLLQEYAEGDLIMTKPASQHPAYKLLHPKYGKPNSWQTPHDFMAVMMINALLGRGALAIKVVVAGQVRELIPVPAGAFTVETLSDYGVQYRVQFSDGSQQVFTQDQVLFVHGISLDGYTAVSMLDKARQAVGLAKSLENQQLQLAAKGGNPSGILTLQGELAADRKTMLRDAWNAAYGAGGSGGIAVLDGGAGFSPVSMSMADSQFIENRRFQIEEVGRIFNIQPLFLGHNAGVNVDGVDAALRLHVKTCLRPWYIRFEQVLNRDILGNAPGFFFDFDEKDLLRGDMKAMIDSFTKGLGAGGAAGIFSVNEVRQEFGLNPINEEYALKPTMGGYAQAAGLDKIREGVSLLDPEAEESGK